MRYSIPGYLERDIIDLSILSSIPAQNDAASGHQASIAKPVVKIKKQSSAPAEVQPVSTNVH